MTEKQCAVCGVCISYKKSNNASKCDKCLRVLTPKMRGAIIDRQKTIPEKNKVLSAYNKECAVCGWCISDENASIILSTQNKNLRQRGCELHHITPVRDGGKSTFENLILLCPNHHKEADLGIISIDELKNLIPTNMEDAIDNRRLGGITGEELIDNLF